MGITSTVHFEKKNEDSEHEDVITESRSWNTKKGNQTA